MRGWQVLKIWGVPFKIHPYWIVLLFLFSWSISDQINLTSSDIFNKQEAWIIGFFTSFLLLCSIIFHQIFHTYICIIENEGLTREGQLLIIFKVKKQQKLSCEVVNELRGVFQKHNLI